MKDSQHKIGPIQKTIVILVTGALMVVCGVGTFVMGMMFLMNLGTKLHDNYEYYGQTPAVALIFVAGVLGFLAPGVAVWCLCRTQRPWRFSVRTLLIAMTLVAAVLGVAVYAVK